MTGAIDDCDDLRSKLTATEHALRYERAQREAERETAAQQLEAAAGLLREARDTAPVRGDLSFIDWGERVDAFLDTHQAPEAPICPAGQHRIVYGDTTRTCVDCGCSLSRSQGVREYVGWICPWCHDDHRPEDEPRCRDGYEAGAASRQAEIDELKARIERDHGVVMMTMRDALADQQRAEAAEARLEEKTRDYNDCAEELYEGYARGFAAASEGALASQQAAEARTVREICEWLRSDGPGADNCAVIKHRLSADFADRVAELIEFGEYKPNAKTEGEP